METSFKTTAFPKLLMDPSEQIAQKYLRSIGFERIVFQPDGIQTPDFLVNDEIAVEVRRLNLNFTTSDGKTKGHEEDFIPILQRFNNYLPLVGSSKDGDWSWYVSFEISRPLEPWSEIRSHLDLCLKAFMGASPRVSQTIQITPHFRINIFRAGQQFKTFFVLGSGADDVIGGQVIEDVRRNLEICIKEKTRKVAPFRARYLTWWLVLSDHISLGMDFEDQRQFKELPPIAHDWQRVILVNPRNPSDAFDV